MAERDVAQHYGIVLHAVPVRESDLIVSVLTPELGRISAGVRGARRSKRRFLGGVDLFDCGLFSLNAPRSSRGIYQVSALSEREQWIGLRADLTKFQLASFCLEVCWHFAPEGDIDGGRLFAALRDALRAINAARNDIDGYAAAVQLALRALSQSGLDPLRDDLRISAAARSWWQTLIEAFTLPESEGIVIQSFMCLFHHIERVVGRRLRTHGEFRFHGTAISLP